MTRAAWVVLFVVAAQTHCGGSGPTTPTSNPNLSISGKAADR